MHFTDNTYDKRIEGLFYSRSDEKFTLRTLLDELLGDSTFENALDVGPGPGHISEPLARRSKRLVLVEKAEKYEEDLKRQFENAQVLIGSINDVNLGQDAFDLILLSHMHYYLPESQWMELTERMYQRLAPGGELILILNADYGDWWKIVRPFWDEMREFIAFHYITLSQFKRDLTRLGNFSSHPYRYQMWVDPGAQWIDFVARQVLELTSESLIEQNQQRFNELAKGLKQVDGSFVLDFRGELLRLKKAK